MIRMLRICPARPTSLPAPSLRLPTTRFLIGLERLRGPPGRMETSAETRESVQSVRSVRSVFPLRLSCHSSDMERRGARRRTAEHQSHPNPECILPLPTAPGGAFVGTSAFHRFSWHRVARVAGGDAGRAGALDGSKLSQRLARIRARRRDRSPSARPGPRGLGIAWCRSAREAVCGRRAGPDRPVRADRQPYYRKPDLDAGGRKAEGLMTG